MSRYIVAAVTAAFTIAFISLVTVASFANVEELPPVTDAAMSFAQPAPPPVLIRPAADGSGWDFTPLLANLQQFVASVLVLVLTWLAARLAAPLNKYFGTRIQAEEVIKDLNMGRYAGIVVGEAVAYAKQRTGLTDADMKDVEIRNPVLSLAAGFIFKQYPEIWKWIEQSEKGAMEFIEAKLSPAAALAPNVVAGVGPVPKV